MSDVARLAGVSAQTVSNVLNGRKGFTSETRARVLDAVGRTGYHGDPAARQLRTGHSRKIGICLTSDNLDPRQPFSLALLQAVLVVAEEYQRRVIVFLNDATDMASFEADVASAEVDGFLLANSAPGDPRVDVLERLDVPFALMGRTQPSQPSVWLDIDNAHAIGEAVDHLVERGARRFAFAGFIGENHWTVGRVAGVQTRLANYDIGLPATWSVAGTIEDIEWRCSEILRARDRPDAVITGSDTIALTVMNIAQSQGLRVGEDLLVTGFDGSGLTSAALRSLTSVSIPVPAIARELVVDLIRQTETGQSIGLGRTVPTQLLVGRSTAPAVKEAR